MGIDQQVLYGGVGSTNDCRGVRWTDIPTFLKPAWLILEQFSIGVETEKRFHVIFPEEKPRSQQMVLLQVEENCSKP
jgi:hypothetical protein